MLNREEHINSINRLPIPQADREFLLQVVEQFFAEMAQATKNKDQDTPPASDETH